MTSLLSLLLALIAATAAFGLMFWLGATRQGPRVTLALLLRLIVVFIPTFAACLPLLCLTTALFSPLRISPLLGIPASLLAAGAATYFTCLRTSAFPSDFLGSVLLGAFVTGGFAFSAGHLLPKVFAPASRDSLVLGALLLGPLGFCLGAIGGARYWSVRHSRKTATTSLRAG